MNFNGWVKYRRGIIEHVLDGRLSGLEHYALSQLILLADGATGGDRINAPMLAYYTGHIFNQDTAARILASLNDKRYILYRGVRFSKKPQPYWIDGYVFTKGPMKPPMKSPMKDRWTDLSQLFDKPTVTQQDVWDFSNGDAYDGADGDAYDGADNYKKGEWRHETKENPTNSKGRALKCDTGSDLRHDIKAAPRGAPMVMTQGAPCGRATEVSLVVRPEVSHEGEPHHEPHDEPRKQYASSAGPFVWADEIPGYRFVTGGTPVYVCEATGRRISSYDEALKIAQTGGTT